MSERVSLVNKPSLAAFYGDIFHHFKSEAQLHPSGTFLEVGSGDTSFLAKRFIPTIKTSDIHPYEGLDLVCSASKIPLADNSVSCIFGINSLHHFPNAEEVLREFSRLLKPGGKIVLFDQTTGPLAQFIFKTLHHENFDMNATNWSFDSSDPLNDANGAMAWLIFQRDHKKFKKLYPELELIKIEPHSSLTYFLLGGFKTWSLLPASLVPFALKIDRWICRLIPSLTCFAFYTIEKSK